MKIEDTVWMQRPGTAYHVAILSKSTNVPCSVTFLVKWNGAYYTKNAVKLLISNPDGLVP